MEGEGCHSRICQGFSRSQAGAATSSAGASSPCLRVIAVYNKLAPVDLSTSHSYTLFLFHLLRRGLVLELIFAQATVLHFSFILPLCYVKDLSCITGTHSSPPAVLLVRAQVPEGAEAEALQDSQDEATQRRLPASWDNHSANLDRFASMVGHLGPLIDLTGE